jgi:phosphoribosyl 1,2-cyclic phosphate phosphodiesterase
MRVTFLGTGTSHGIPVIGCDCAVCRSDDPRNKRLRPSVLVEDGDASVLIDATPDFRAQALRTQIRRLDAVLITHAHADHVLGLDDLRAFTERTGQPMPIYSSAKWLADIKRMFPYACTEKPAWESLPRFQLRPIEPGTEFDVAGLRVRSVEVLHGRAKVLGFVFGRQFAYLTDCNAIAPEVVQSIRNVTVLTLDGLRHRLHPTHLTITAACEIAAQANARLTWLTHLCHEVDHAEAEQRLPPQVRLAYDNLQVKVEGSDYQTIG